MAAAPLVGIAFSAAGQVASIVGGANERGRARASSEAQVRASQRSHELEKQRFNYAENAASQQYLQEAVIIQEQSRQAREALAQARIQQDMIETQQVSERAQTNTQLQSQVQQMLGAAANVRTEAGSANAQDLFQLVTRLGEARGGRNQLMQRLADASQSSLQTNAITGQELSDYQNTFDLVSTRDRVKDIQGSALERRAGISSDYAKLVDEYLATTQGLQNQMTRFTLERQPTLLNIQQQRNEAALESARFSNAAESNLGRLSSSMNLLNNTETARLSVPGGGFGSAVSGIFGTLGQVVPQVITNWNTVFGSPARQSMFGTTRGFTTGSGGNIPNSGVYSFGGDGAQPAPGQIINRNRAPYSGRTQQGLS